MTEILTVLGRRSRREDQLVLVGTFVAVTLAFLALVEVVEGVAGVPAVAAQAALWVAWFAWHSIVFPRCRRRHVRADPQAAYRAVFYTNIVPGVSAGVALMATPLVHAVVSAADLAGPLQLVLAATVTAAGLALLLAGFVAIGFASAGFLYEYVRTPEPIVLRGIYASIRHPLFLGGVVASLGTALLFEVGAIVALGLTNVAFLAVYMVLEDARLCAVFGESYEDYRARVGGFVPVDASLARAAHSFAARLGAPT